MFVHFLFSEIQGETTVIWEKRGKFLISYTLKANTLLLLNHTISGKTEFLILCKLEILLSSIIALSLLLIY